MKKKLTIITTALTIFSSIANAQSQSRFAGGYIGANAGYASGTSTVSDYDENLSYQPTLLSPAGASGGLTLGYNWVNKSVLYGVEFDHNLMGISDRKVTTYPGDIKSEINSYSTLRGRAGFVVDNGTLFFLTAGVAVAKIDADGKDSDDGSPATDNEFKISKNVTGITFGAGVEHAFSNQLSLKAEYLTVDLPGIDTNDLIDFDDAGDTYNIASKFNTFRIGLNYKF
jgi:outer membrane immunogenic protein